MTNVGLDSSLNADFMDLVLQWLIVHQKAWSSFGVSVKTYDYQVEGDSLEEISQ